VDCDDDECSDSADCQPDAFCGDGFCDPGEDCETCETDCSGRSKGKKSEKYCCGNGILEPAEGPNGEVCDGNY
jgi:hypothetical protein